MSKYYISELDRQLNKKPIALEKGLLKVCKYIKNKIDPNFNSEDFMLWVNSDNEKAFVCNGNKYYWE